VSVLKDVPVWAFHGKKDPVVVFERGESMVKNLKSAGGNVRFTVYPEAGHDSWTETYQNPEFYEWLLGQKRGVRLQRQRERDPRSGSRPNPAGSPTPPGV
jgi:predicted peptidase